MRSYTRFDGAALPHQVGSDTQDGCRIGDGKAGILSYGPYASLSPGVYKACFYIRRPGTHDLGSADMDVCHSGGQLILAQRRVPASEILCDIAGLIDLDFTLKESVEDLEVRLHVPEDLILEIRELVIFSHKHSDWGSAE